MNCTHNYNTLHGLLPWQQQCMELFLCWYCSLIIFCLIFSFSFLCRVGIFLFCSFAFGCSIFLFLSIVAKILSLHSEVCCGTFLTQHELSLILYMKQLLIRLGQGNFWIIRVNKILWIQVSFSYLASIWRLMWDQSATTATGQLQSCFDI